MLKLLEAEGENRTSKTKMVALPAALAAIALGIARASGYDIDIDPAIVERFFDAAILLAAYFLRRAV